VAFEQATVTIGNEPTLIATGDRDGETITVRNTGENTIWLGGDAVTDTAGFPLNAGEVISFDVKGPEALYGIADDDTPIHVLRHE